MDLRFPTVTGCLIYIGLFVATFAGWIHHVVWCLQHHEWGFLIAGALVFPVAVIHGWGLWFGWFG